MTDYECIRRPTEGAASDGKYLDFGFDTTPPDIWDITSLEEYVYINIRRETSWWKDVIKSYTFRHSTSIGKECSASGTGLNSLK